MLSRSGTSGINRFGAALWSGDIAGNLASLATALNCHMHMSMSGIDYFGNDIGGFRRPDLDGFPVIDNNEMYTQWFANAMWFDIPARPHTENLCNCRETAPDRIGHLQSNRANIRQRYELIPYYYSLAHRAWLYGEAVMPPLVYNYQADSNVREMGHEKMIGQFLLIAVVAGHDEYERNVYLPSGKWINYHSNEWHTSTGQWVNYFAEYRNNEFKLPAFAKEGAIFPKMYVDAQTKNTFGVRKDGSTRNELIVRAYTSASSTSFTLYEDDGRTKAYLSGSVRTTLLSRSKSGSVETITVAASSGTYTSAPSSRNTVVELVLDNQKASAVTYNGASLAQYTTQVSFDAATDGWINWSYNLVKAKKGSISVTTSKAFAFTLTSATAETSANFVCKNCNTGVGEACFAVGNVGQLGNWNVPSAIKLDPVSYPVWTGVIKLPVSTSIEWKCVKRLESGGAAIAWESGSNNLLTTPASGYVGHTEGVM
jgi:alpha-glucosidase